MSGAQALPARWTVESEHGAEVTFADGETCLDLNSGLWNASLGYGHVRVIQSIKNALDRISYGAQFRRNSVLADQLAAKLLSLWEGQPFSRLMFATSGSAANDMVIKLARSWSSRMAMRERKLIASLKGSYHGQTLGALGTSDEYLMQPEMLMDASSYRRLSVTSGDRVHEALQRWGDKVAAVFVEPVQGTGNRTVAPGVLRELFAARREHGFLIVADEVATGFGRTGQMFRSASWEEAPDAVVMSKGLTNGTMAMSCVLLAPRIAEAFSGESDIFPHAETQAGGALGCAAALGVLDAFASDLGMQTALSRLPEAGRLRSSLEQLNLDRRGIELRGEGYFYTLEMLDMPRTQPVEDLRSRGLIVHGGEQGIQLAPSYLMSEAQWSRFIETLDGYFHLLFGI